MFEIMFCLFFLLSIPTVYSQSLEFKSLDNATIPTTTKIEVVEGISFEKTSRNSSGFIYLSFVLLNTMIFTEEVVLTINNEKQIVKVFDFNKEQPRVLRMYITKEVSNNSIFYKIMFTKIENAKSGVYKLCIGPQFCATSFIFSSPISIKFSKPKLGLEGDPLRITCSYEAYPEVTEIIWSVVHGSNLTTANVTTIYTNDHIKLQQSKDSNVTNATLFIKELIKNDSGIYMCTVISERGRDFSIVRINVKDRWAALYPFIGIVIEVIILVTAILAYERYQIRSQNRKNKNYDDDNKDHDIPLATGGGDDDNVVVPPGENGCPTVEMEGEKLNSADQLRQRDAMTKNV